MSDELMLSLRSGGPVSPVVQLRRLLTHGRERGWEFDVAWRWSYERIKWPHDTAHRLEWKGILGETVLDEHVQPVKQRESWRSAYERTPPSRRESSVGRLLVAA